MKRDIEDNIIDEEEFNVIYRLVDGELVPVTVEDDNGGDKDAQNN